VQRHKEKVKALKKGPCVLGETFAIIAVKNVLRRKEKFYLRGRGGHREK
jgi:hypothetical protein